MRSPVLYQYPSINHYEILGVERHASPIEIRTAYMALVKTYHPDNAPVSKRQASTQIFKMITEAYNTLSDVNKRKLYDRALIVKTKGAEQDVTNDNTVEPLWRKIFKQKS